jgi:hypothetical protein
MAFQRRGVVPETKGVCGWNEKIQSRKRKQRTVGLECSMSILQPQSMKSRVFERFGDQAVSFMIR